MLIAIPSKGRAGNVQSLDRLLNGTLYVPENEAQDYRRCYPNVIAVPGDIRGITKTRNWILKNTDDRWVVFADDDAKTVGWTELLEEHGKQRQLSAQEVTGEFIKLFEITEGMRYRIWGVATQAALRSVYPWSPFLFQSYVTGSCMGIINDGKTLFDEDFPVKEDYELCLRCIYEDGGIVAARYMYFECEHWTTDGGCKDYRTQEMEAKAIRNLIKKYGRCIRQITRHGSGYSIELNF